MSRIVRFEFMGSWVLFWLMCISGVGIPLGILYLVNGIVRIEQDIDDPERFLQAFRARR